MEHNLNESIAALRQAQDEIDRLTADNGSLMN
jgi:hypothetical protein